MRIEAARLHTFSRWPHTKHLLATPPNLAAAGFFYRPNNENVDRVACFACGVHLVNWEPNDDPLQEHLAHAERCAFVRNESRENVPLIATLAHRPLQTWTRLCGRIEPLNLRADEIVVGRTSAGSAWFACAIPPHGVARKPSIFLFNLERAAAQPLEILLDLFATCLVDAIGLAREPVELRKQRESESRSFDWLNSIDDLVTTDAQSSQPQTPPTQRAPLCEITALCTVAPAAPKTTFGARSERIVALLATAVAVKEDCLRKCEF